MNLETDTENMVRNDLFLFLKEKGQQNLEQNVNELMYAKLGSHYDGRFLCFDSQLSKQDKNSLLISGCVVGSELIVARRYGFKKIYGVEVDHKYVDLCKKRLKSIKDMTVNLYNGIKLPYEDKFFNAVYSGHIIEHTSSPWLYFYEMYRVLKPGGLFYLEFPHRYYYKELHTNLLSFEWLPSFLRTIVLRLISSKVSFFPSSVKRKYRDILKTLKPISIWQIKLFLHKLDNRNSKIIYREIPCPGIVRLIIKK